MKQSSTSLHSHFLSSPAVLISLIIPVFIMLQRAFFASVCVCAFTFVLLEEKKSVKLKAEVVVSVPAIHY